MSGTGSAEAQRLARSITTALEGDPWYGSSMLALLEDVDAAAAFARPRGVAHSIADIVRHTTGWAIEIERRFRREQPQEPPGGNWPVGGEGDESWRQAVQALRAAHARLAETVRGLTDEDLEASAAADSLGEPITLRREAAGLAQHIAYHSGQVAIVKQALAGQGMPLA